MANEVEIRIHNRQIILGSDETQENTIEESAAGQLYRKGDSLYLIYDEVLSEDAAPVHNTCKLCRGTMQLTKKGDVRVTMLFEEGREHKTGYITPYGTFEMLVRTQKVSYAMKEDGLEILAEYELELDGAPLSRNQLKLSAKAIDSATDSR